MKSMLKEDVRPKAADAFVFTLAPLITATMASSRSRSSRSRATVWMFGHLTPLQLTDIPVAVLLVLAVAGVGIYGIVLAGWSSGSTYPLLGGLRSTAQMISYEIAMGLSLVAVFLYSGSMSTSQIVGGAVRPLVHHPGVLQLLRLRHHDGRRDQPAALRPRRGRGRAHRWLPHRVRLDALRDVLPRRVHQHVHRRRARDDDVPRRLAGPSRHRARSTTACSTRAGGACCGSPSSCGCSCSSSSGCAARCPRVRYDQFMRFGWKFLIPVDARAGSSSSPSSAAARTAGSAAASTVAGRRFPVATSLLPRRRHRRRSPLGPAAWLWDRRAEAKEAAAHPGRARGDRPVRRGLPRAAPARPAPARALARAPRP